MVGVLSLFHELESARGLLLDNEYLELLDESAARLAQFGPESHQKVDLSFRLAQQGLRDDFFVAGRVEHKQLGFALSS